ncbi:hypothetical protein GGX14DRAFT_583756 [Mycena pura]|uniref:Arrestin-like N-terminal domain-containing protein n=1 Tax=Mycena pura TaxID=153505 RepID=A0AAD6YW48_9AGAR|nr:hypothetical protein GGX14DRAFT_583756 [Mycena pura]
MSLLRDVLKKPNKRDTASIKSAGARSVVASLYSLAIGGEHVKKRRRPDFSALGAPEWHHGDPPLPPDMPGTAAQTDICAYTIAHATVLPLRLEDKNHWLSLIFVSGRDVPQRRLASRSIHLKREIDSQPAKVAGEVRLFLEKTKSISSIDVWLAVVAPAGQIVSLTANVWNRHKGNPLHPDQKPEHYKDKFPKGTFVFPFELPPLPKFVPVTHPDNDKQRLMLSAAMDAGSGPTAACVIILHRLDALIRPHAASGKIHFTCGVGVRRDSVNGIDEDMDMILQYFPLYRRLTRHPVPFPFLVSREDWPLKRETVGGWVLSPFGGRGRIGTQMVEVEGLLGVQDPALCTAGHTLEFTVLLWSKSADALKLLAQPAAVTVRYLKADFMPSSEALRPREQSRKTRTLERMAEGRVWAADGERPQEGAPMPELVRLHHLSETGTDGGVSHDHIRPFAGSRMQSWTADSDDGGGVADDDGGDEMDDALADLAGGETDHFTQLDGDLHIPPCRPVSYRYTDVGREYSLELQFAHPQYAHVSPTGPGLVAEVPVWFVVDRPPLAIGPPAALNAEPMYLADLPLKGATIPVGADAVRWPKVVGTQATTGRGGKAKLGQPFVGLVPPPKETTATS